MSSANGHYHLLFLTICFMTSGGYFMSSTNGHHHHLSTHPTFIPAVSRFLPHQHVIMRRDSLPQQQHSSFIHHKTHHPITTPPVMVVKKVDVLQIEEELKALKKKRKRLRQLREEVRELSDHLKSKRAFSKDDTSRSDLLEKHKMKETHVRWRKQMTTRIKAIMKRLKRLENDVKIERNFAKEKKKTKRLPVLPLNFHTVQSSPHTLITTNKNFKIKRLHSSINQSKNGESGGICFGHNDCKPGLCCHRTSSMDANSSITSTANFCYQYMLKEGELCEDSCQCEARLHCFRSSHQLKTDRSIKKLKRSMYAICKKVSTSDIVNGIYLNSKDSLFLTKPSIQQL